jgi:hypothetical protein
MIKPYNLKMRSGLYYKRFMIVIYDCKGTFKFAVYLTIAIYKFLVETIVITIMNYSC